MTQTPISQLDFDTRRRSRNLFLLSSMMILVTVALTTGAFLLLFNPAAWQFYVLVFGLVAQLVASILSRVYTQQEDTFRAVVILLVGIWTGLLFGSAVVADLGLPLALTGILISWGIVIFSVGPELYLRFLLPVLVTGGLTYLVSILSGGIQALDHPFLDLGTPFALVLVTFLFALIGWVRFRQFPIAAKWLTALITGAIIVSLFVGGYFFIQEIRQQEQILESRLVDFTQSAAGDLQSRLQDAAGSFIRFSFSTGVQNYLDVFTANPGSPLVGEARQELEKAMLVYLETNPEINQVSLLNTAGQEIARADSLPGQAPRIVPAAELLDLSTQSFFVIGLRLGEGQVFIPALVPDQDPASTTLTFSTPLVYSGETEGLLRASFYAEAFFASLENNPLPGENSVLALVNPEGNYLYHSNPEKRWTGQENPGTSLEEDYPPLISLIQSSPAGISGLETISAAHQEIQLPDQAGSRWYLLTLGPPTANIALTDLPLSTVAILMVSSVILIGIASSFISPQLTNPIRRLTEVAETITSGSLEADFPPPTEDEIGVLNLSFKRMTNELRETVSSLENRVQERTSQLETRSRQLQSASEIGKTLATIRDPERVLPLVTQMISDRFGFYHTGIFLLDEAREYAVLEASNSPGGQHMLSRGHRLRVGEEGMVGFVTAQKEPRIALDVGQDAVFFNNPDLPLTRSEMTLPLLVGDDIIGALDIQSTEKEAFSQDDINVLQVLADQVAIAINNSQLLAQTRDALEKSRQAFGERTRQAWLQILAREQGWGYEYRPSANSLQTVSRDEDPFTQQAIQSGEIVVNPHDYSLTIPIKIRDQVIGVFSLRKDNPAPWTERELGLMDNLADQMGQVLENARLYEATQQRVTYEQMTSQITAQIRETLDVDMVLQTAIQEIRDALDLDVVMVQLEGEQPEKQNEINPQEN